MIRAKMSNLADVVSTGESKYDDGKAPSQGLGGSLSRGFFLAERDATFIYDGTCEKITIRRGESFLACVILTLTAPARLPLLGDVVRASQHTTLATASNIMSLGMELGSPGRSLGRCSTGGVYKRWIATFGVPS